jgi:hypothetical protein
MRCARDAVCAVHVTQYARCTWRSMRCARDAVCAVRNTLLRNVCMHAWRLYYMHEMYRIHMCIMMHERYDVWTKCIMMYEQNVLIWANFIVLHSQHMHVEMSIHGCFLGHTHIHIRYTQRQRNMHTEEFVDWTRLPHKTTTFIRNQKRKSQENTNRVRHW